MILKNSIFPAKQNLNGLPKCKWNLLRHLTEFTLQLSPTLEVMDYVGIIMEAIEKTVKGKKEISMTKLVGMIFLISISSAWSLSSCKTGLNFSAINQMMRKWNIGTWKVGNQYHISWKQRMTFHCSVMSHFSFRRAHITHFQLLLE